MNKALLTTFFLLLFCFIAYSQWSVKTVPDPKTNGEFFVSNPDHILSAKEVAFLDSIIKEVKDSSRAEIAVVMLQSIGDEIPKAFATELFNFWGVGHAETDNGLLILFILDQRRIEFETGYGIEQVLSDAKCYEIQQDFMIPRFKEEKYGQGIIDGVTEIVELLMGRASEITPEETATNTDDYSYDNDYNERYYDIDYGIIYAYLKLAGVVFVLFILLFLISLIVKDHFVRYQILRIFRIYIWLILFPVPFIGVFFFVKYLTDKWRNTPRISAKTGLIMHKLNEEEDDKYLQSGQITEEKIKSIDYDVWVSGEDGDVLIQAYKRWFSKYNACPKCRFKTYYKVYDKVIISPTYTSSGKGESLHKCENCGHSRKNTYTIPKKTKTSSSSSSSSSWGGSSSSWSSSGSSWGGGSSGGGGAGSSW